MTEEPSDATRFATRPTQRKAELANATDNEMAKDRKKTITLALGLLGEGHRWPAQLQMIAGLWRQYSIEDDRTLDPETVAEQFSRAEQELTNAVTIRALIADAGLRP
jgi:hypothetical protein